MGDENQKISIQVPAELLKEMSTFSEEAKAALDDKTLITLQLSPENVAKLTSLGKDIRALEQSEIEEWHANADRFTKSSELRISFHEKLILLAGGSFALSFTFLGSLQRHILQGTTLVAMARLKEAWVLLLLCIVFSWLHNLLRCTAIEQLIATTSTRVTAIHHSWASQLANRAAALFKGMESPTMGISEATSAAAKASMDLSKKSNKDASEYTVKLQRQSNYSAALAGLALLSIILAFAFMLVFAVDNAAFL
jgi:hypothetical protein